LSKTGSTVKTRKRQTTDWEAIFAEDISDKGRGRVTLPGVILEGQRYFSSSYRTCCKFHITSFPTIDPFRVFHIEWPNGKTGCSAAQTLCRAHFAAGFTHDAALLDY
jgi:hypothetical protein